MGKRSRTICRVTLPLLMLVGIAVAGRPAAAGEKGDSMVYELRTYTTADGRLPALHKRFRDHTMKLFKKHGITNVIYWTPADKENTLVYLIAHKSREAADKSWKAFGGDPDWQRVFKESRKDGPIVTKVERRFLRPTDYSPVKAGGLKAAVKDEGLLYELRIYTTNEGKLPNLHARFRDHTMKLFKKHGIRNVLYTTPLDKDNTLVYVIAHKDRQAADKSWAAFRNDLRWQRAREESEKDGKLVSKVQRRYLTPTDYSPVK